MNTRKYPDRADYIVQIKELLSKAGKLDFVLTVMESKGPGKNLFKIKMKFYHHKFSKNIDNYKYNFSRPKSRRYHGGRKAF